ncbi:unnamed protein product [Cyclocybe aegerita]|uniref:Xylanolytic transcriptional activator regulatory domain-containing protein n=1 Tax=Cyclocybe aegerita TaxID=1973307 RepID=A0A8S0W4M8_CYCAE|nr:unnamed protein product [Cyclocybe aegerita]
MALFQSLPHTAHFLGGGCGRDRPETQVGFDILNWYQPQPPCPPAAKRRPPSGQEQEENLNVQGLVITVERKELVIARIFKNRRGVLLQRSMSRSERFFMMLIWIGRYITGLENRLEELEKALHELCPDESIFDAWVDALSKEPDPPPPPTMQFPPLSIFRPAPAVSLAHAIRASHGYTRPKPPLFEEEDDRTESIATSLDTNHFFGKSSSEMLAGKALSMKKQYVGGENNSERLILPNRREEFWSLRPWEQKAILPSPCQYAFPEPDLARDLVELYFDNINLDLPLLHRPSFERSISDGLHYTDEGFAEVYLLVCALGARFSSDRRVLFDGVDSLHSAGWKWFNQVESCKDPILGMLSLYDIQAYCLTILFIQFATLPQAVWLLIGVALRLIQDVGIHRKKTPVPNAEDELWKRAFWVLVHMDRLASIGFGRPLNILNEDIDADLPIDCDDEYWEHPDPRKRFQQPPDKPSLITAFLQQLKLMNILSTCIRLIYPLDKIATHLGLDDEEWKGNIVAELDSSLNKWLRALPEHLRWDPKNTHNSFFRQSARLYITYYHIQILVHRPSITSSSPSHAICNTAARASIRIAEAQLQRGILPQSLFQFAVLTSAIVLLTGVWARKRTSESDRSSVERNPDMELVRSGMRVLSAAEETWPQAGKFRDMLSALSSMSEQPDSGHPYAASIEHERFGRRNIRKPTAPAVWLDKDAHLSLVRDVLYKMLWNEEPVSNDRPQSDRPTAEHHYSTFQLSSFDPSSFLGAPQGRNTGGQQYTGLPGQGTQNHGEMVNTWAHTHIGANLG